MNAQRPNTPGIFGYVLCALASFVACAVLTVVPMVTANGAPEAALIYVPFGILVVAVTGCPVALAGILAMELCRRVRSQGVHVAVAALAGALGTMVYGALVHLGSTSPATLVLAVAVGVSAAIGRTAVIPLVESRRRLAARGQLTGTARW